MSAEQHTASPSTPDSSAATSKILNSSSSITQLSQTFEAQRAYFSKATYPDLATRKTALKQLKALLLDNQDAICAAISEDFGYRATKETLLLEMMTTIGDINYTLHNLRAWMKPERRAVALQFMPASNTVMYQPLGVVGIIVPWNYPLYLSVGPLISAIAAGNCAMLKMSEFTPHFNKALSRILSSKFPAEQISIIEGEADVAAAFSSLAFDHILFTGSANVGKHVMRAAAENLTPVTLELGGKSPAIIDSDIGMNDAVKRIIFGKCANAGQTCVAPDYLLVPKARLEECVSELKSQFTALYPEFDSNPDYSNIVNDRQYSRLLNTLHSAQAAGATITSATDKPYTEYQKGRKLPLQIVTHCPDSASIMQDEIFGPILPIVTYDNIEQAIKYINDRPRPLALYILSHSNKTQQQLLEQTHAGGVGINETIVHVGQEDMPFGGIGPSGMGHYHGKEGFLTFSKAKAIHKKGRIYSTSFIHPPYAKSLLGLVLKLFMK